jgi:ribosome-associated protein
MTATEHEIDPLGTKTRLCYNAAVSKKAEEVCVRDLRGLSDIADIFLIASGRSRIQVQAIVDAVEASLREAGEKSYHIEGYETGNWALLDAGDIVVHVFSEEARRYYGLDRLWADTKPFDVGSPEGADETTRGV